ncbi:MAG: Cytidylyltransferase-like [Bacteroidota bacterium]
MNNLVRYLVESILLEEVKDVVVVYAGRFQPFHKGHYATYQHLVKKFGKDSVYIGTSNTTDTKKSPFNFKEKKLIMTKMFGIPSNQIVMVKNPYRPIEVLNGIKKDTAFITVVGAKDKNRLAGGKYFSQYKGVADKGYEDAGYYYIAPPQPNAVSGTDVRNWLSNGTTDQKKSNFMKAYPKFDASIFKLITDKLATLKTESVKRTTIDDILNEVVKSKRIISEGGAYGHMAHPFDLEMNLTFGDLKNIVKKALNGELELAREKTDGQALAVSWVKGRLVAARNKSHLRNKGEGAMDITQVATKFANRGGLTDAYNFAMKDLESAISGLSDAQKKLIFKDGACFMNLEVIYPESVNVIPYGQPLLVFHGTFEYDMDGNIIGENQKSASILAGMIKQINAEVQSKYTIQGPPVQTLPKNQNLIKKQTKYFGMISKLQKEFGLTDSSNVADYHQAWWEDFVEKNAKGLDTHSKIGLVKRWAFDDKSFRIAGIQDNKIRKWAEGVDKKDKDKIRKDNLIKFEEIFLGVGADVLQFMKSVLTVDPDSAAKSMKKELDTAIKQIQANGTPEQIRKLEIELKRLHKLGGFNKIVPSEGIVFVYNGNTYKLTGAFAPLNQILGVFKFG